MKSKIRNNFILAFMFLVLAACQSPTVNMSPQEVSQLSNQQLCDLSNTYGWEQKLQIEVGKRNLNCDPYYNECWSKGIQPNTPAMGYCIQDLQQKRAMEQQIANQHAALEYERQKQERNLTLENMRLRNQQRTMQAAPPPKRCSNSIFCM